MKLRCVFMTAFLCAGVLLLKGRDEELSKKVYPKSIEVSYKGSASPTSSVIIKHSDRLFVLKKNREISITVNKHIKDPGMLLILDGNKLYRFKYPKARSNVICSATIQLEIESLNEYMAGTKQLPDGCSITTLL